MSSVQFRCFTVRSSQALNSGKRGKFRGAKSHDDAAFSTADGRIQARCTLFRREPDGPSPRKHFIFMTHNLKNSKDMVCCRIGLFSAAGTAGPGVYDHPAARSGIGQAVVPALDGVTAEKQNRTV